MFNKDDIIKFLNDNNIKDYAINEDLIVDVNGDVNLRCNELLTDLRRIPMKFGSVSGEFDCSNNNLTTLENCPHTVKKFDCSENSLTDLKHCPLNITLDFYANNNKLSTLIDFPKSIKNLSTLDFSRNNIYDIDNINHLEVSYLRLHYNNLNYIQKFPNVTYELRIEKNKLHHDTILKIIDLIEKKLSLTILTLPFYKNENEIIYNISINSSIIEDYNKFLIKQELNSLNNIVVKNNIKDKIKKI